MEEDICNYSPTVMFRGAPLYKTEFCCYNTYFWIYSKKSAFYDNSKLCLNKLFKFSGDHNSFAFNYFPQKNIYLPQLYKNFIKNQIKHYLFTQKRNI